MKRALPFWVIKRGLSNFRWLAFQCTLEYLNQTIYRQKIDWLIFVCKIIHYGSCLIIANCSLTLISRATNNIREFIWIAYTFPHITLKILDWDSVNSYSSGFPESISTSLDSVADSASIFLIARASTFNWKLVIYFPSIIWYKFI